jgi:hypothetical protein
LRLILGFQYHVIAMVISEGIRYESGVVTTALFLLYFCVLNDDYLIRAGRSG